jgi:hypothetical protein
MTCYHQLFCATHRIHIPDEDVTELAPDDLKRIGDLEGALNKMTDIVIVLILMLIFFIALFLLAWCAGIITVMW